MAKKLWPKRLVTASAVLVKGVPERSQLNACIGPQLDDQIGLFWYAQGFRAAGRRLVDELVANDQTSDFTLDTVVYPIVFVYRHHFELLLKLIIRECDKANGGKGGFPKGHKLGPLWTQCRTLIEAMFKAAEWSQNAVVGQLLAELDKIDPTGQAARYPHDTDGKKSFAGQPLLNVEHFASTADRLSDYLGSILRAVESRG
jgi:hypothetical protein